jgi:uncharacterized membrane protein
MFDRSLEILTFIAALGCGLAAGVFFAFSSFVMPALGRIPATSGIGAMQSINIVVINPLFMGVFLGTGALCIVLLSGAWSWWGDLSGKLVLAASLVYLLACIGVTMVFNVPLNDALATTQADSAEAAGLWSRYLTEWTAWNHVRTVAPVLSMALLVLALIRRASL